MADPDLQITWIRGGPGHLNPVIRGGVGGGGGAVAKRFFSALQVSVWSKNKEGAISGHLNST